LSSTRDFHLLLFHLHLISSSSVSTTPYHTSISAALHTSHPYHTSISAAFHTSHLHIRSLPHLTPPYPQPSTPHTSISAAFHTSHLHIRSLPHLTTSYHTSISAAFHTSHLRSTPPYPQPPISRRRHLFPTPRLHITRSQPSTSHSHRSVPGIKFIIYRRPLSRNRTASAHSTPCPTTSLPCVT
jgi:hypothetical protein